jgi:hypothetical protein
VDVMGWKQKLANAIDKKTQAVDKWEQRDRERRSNEYFAKRAAYLAYRGLPLERSKPFNKKELESARRAEEVGGRRAPGPPLQRGGKVSHRPKPTKKFDYVRGMGFDETIIRRLG